MMLEAGIIEPIEETESISTMVAWDKNIGEIIICIDMCKLNDAFLHDPFHMSFTYGVLENFGGHESFSLIDGF